MRNERGSVLIIVMWVAFGLVSIALYFAHTMTSELRASDNRTASLEADQAIEGAARYVNYVLTQMGTNGQVPDPKLYQCEAVQVGQSRFWLIGRDLRANRTPTEPAFALVDEASKLNLNTATLGMLQMLPRMTPELAAAIIDWRDTDSTVTVGGAETETYNSLPTPYNCKNAPFETIDELRLVYGFTLDILYGEDANLNGVLDLNENDGPLSLPDDNRDGKLDSGIFEYLTVYSRQPNTMRTNITQRAQLQPLLQQTFGSARANTILQNVGMGTTQGQGPGNPPAQLTAAPSFDSVLGFYLSSRMSIDEFSQIATNLAMTNGPVEGLINVNTARAEVLACVPGISNNVDNATGLVAYRQSNPNGLASIAWVTQVLSTTDARGAGRYLTTESYQFSADIAAVGHLGRGYSRVRFIFDTSDGTPKIRYRQDLTRLGWALGNTTRLRLPLLAAETRIR